MLRLMEKLNSHGSQKIVTSDNFAAHHMASVCAVANHNENKTAPLTANATLYQQLPYQMFREFKRRLKKSFLQHSLEKAAVMSTSTKKIPHPTYSELGGFFDEICAELNREGAVPKAWRLCGMGPGPSLETMNAELKALLAFQPSDEAKQKALHDAKVPNWVHIAWGNVEAPVFEVEIVEDDAVHYIPLVRWTH